MPKSEFKKNPSIVTEMKNISGLGTLAEIIDTDRGQTCGCVVMKMYNKFAVVHSNNMPTVSIGDTFSADCTIKVRVLEPGEQVILSNN